jgi:hypothetical protein
MKKTVTLLAMMLSLAGSVCSQPAAEAEKPKPAVEAEEARPDLWAREIVAPKGLLFGPGNEVRVIVENLTKESETASPVKVELVVIQSDPKDRASYFTEVESLRFGQKKEVVFTGVEVKNKEFVRLLAIVDSEKVVDESNEDNNRRLYKVWIKQAEPAPAPSPETEE